MSDETSRFHICGREPENAVVMRDRTDMVWRLNVCPRVSVESREIVFVTNMSVPILFCPFCGKRLGGDSDERH